MDLGCGRGLTSVFLAEKFGVQVFTESFFDGVVSVDSYHYFGNNDFYFEKTLKPILKEDAIVAIAFPGMKYEVHDNIPEEMKPLWDEESLDLNYI